MQTRLWKYFGKGLPPCKAGGFKADPRSGRVLRALAVIEDGELSRGSGRRSCLMKSAVSFLIRS